MSAESFGVWRTIRLYRTPVTAWPSFPHAFGGNPVAHERNLPMCSLDARQKRSGMKTAREQKRKLCPRAVYLCLIRAQEASSNG